MKKFKPYREHIQYITLHGCGEPLLDKGLAEKVKIAKEMGFKGTGFATNCTELNEHKSREIIKAGLDTIICSIDGINKHTHEAIRVGTNFEKTVHNVKNYIKIRNESGKTRVIIRFIRQEINKEEWPLFFDYWSRQLNKDFGDEVVKFDVDSDPIRIYNNEIFNHYRKMMLEGRTLELEHCKNCTIPRSRALKRRD